MPRAWTHAFKMLKQRACDFRNQERFRNTIYFILAAWICIQSALKNVGSTRYDEAPRWAMTIMVDGQAVVVGIANTD